MNGINFDLVTVA